MIISFLLVIPLPLMESIPFMEPLEETNNITGNEISGEVNITGNHELIQFINEINGTGNGTVMDPYVISNFKFNGEGDDHCLVIFNVDLYLEISDSDFTGTGNDTFASALFFKSVENFTIKDCSFYDNGRAGAVLQFCSGSITSSVFINNSIYGLVMGEYGSANERRIENCTFSKNEIGFRSWGMNTVKNCTFRENDIGLDASDDDQITCCGSSYISNRIGMIAYYFREISNNSFLNNEEFGMNIHNHDHANPNEIKFNTFKDNDGTALRIDSCSMCCSVPTIISNNIVINSEVGISITGIGVAIGNRISSCSEVSLGVGDGKATLRNNTLIGAGIFCNLSTSLSSSQI